jgi:hypothetical protein
MDEVLTKTFEFMKFPKPTPKKKKTIRDYIKIDKRLVKSWNIGKNKRVAKHTKKR